MDMSPSRGRLRLVIVTSSASRHRLSDRVFFPFGRPEGALKATLALLECVLHKDMVMPPSQDEVRGVIKKCLENAALVNYTKLSADTRIEGG